MSISISPKNDYSFLFSNLNGSTSSNSLSSLTSLLSDYSSIKTGSYSKLMKAYYSKVDSEDTASDTKKNSAISTVSTAVKALNTLETKSDVLKESADALYTTGSDSVFKQTGIVDGTKQYDVDAIYKAVNSFVTDYNSVIKASDDVTDTTVSNRITNLKSISNTYKNSLDKMGITINEDNTLKLDADKFKASDMGSVKTLFNGTGSYGYSVSAQASLIGYASSSAANSANSYTSSGTYAYGYNAGSLFNGMF